MTAAAPTLPTIAADSTSSALTVTSLLTQAGYHDPDGAALAKGIAIVGTSAASPGSWQYMVSANHWLPLPPVSSAAALLLPATASLRFASNNQLGTATLTFAGWDETQGTSGAIFNVAASGGAAAFSTAVVALNVTVRPTVAWSATTGPRLTPVLPGTAANPSKPAGDSVAAVFGGFFLTNNPAVSVGVAIVGSSGAKSGVWQFSRNAGASWTPMPTASATSAVLLSGSDEIRFVPANNFAGRVSLSALAWNGAGGTDGTPVNPNMLGTAVSAGTISALCSVNTAPVLAGAGVTLKTINENALSPAVTAAALLADAHETDADGKAALSGIAVIGASGPGTWQWLDGTVWTAIPSVSSSQALLLSSTSTVRFAPTNYQASSGAAALTYLAWDQTAGTSGMTETIAGLGGATPFSATAAIANLPVNFVSQAPTWAAGVSAAFTPVLPFSSTNPQPDPPGDGVASVFGNAFRAAAGIQVGVAITAQTGNADGTWEFSTDDGNSWRTFPTVSNQTPLHLSANDLVRFVPSKPFSGAVSLTAKAWDGGTGLSTATLTATGVVNAAPLLNP